MSSTASTVSISAIVFDLIDFRVITIPESMLPIVPKTEKTKTFIDMRFVMSRLILLLENNMKYNNLKGPLFTFMLIFYKVLQNESTFNTYWKSSISELDETSLNMKVIQKNNFKHVIKFWLSIYWDLENESLLDLFLKIIKYKAF